MATRCVRRSIEVAALEGGDPQQPPATFYVLLLSSTVTSTGYAILKEPRKLSDDRFHIGLATLHTKPSNVSWITAG